jgi:hypothetical protein
MSPAEAACPRCHTLLDLEWLRDTGAHRCPFCDANVSAELDAVAIDSAGTVSGGREPWRGDLQVPDSALIRPLPPESRLQVVQSGGGRLVLSIPPGGSDGKSLWVFALCFLGVLAVITTVFVMILVAGGAQQQGSPLVILPFLGFFWLLALGVWWVAVRMRSSRTLLSVDRERVVLQTTLFGHTWQTELPVASTTECSLVEAYSINDVPVHQVQVSSQGQTLGFGTSLSPAEKVWLVDEIEHTIGMSPVAESPGPTDDGRAAATMRLGGDRGAGTLDNPTGESPLQAGIISPREITATSAIKIEADLPDLLELTFPTFHTSPGGRSITALALIYLALLNVVFLGCWRWFLLPKSPLFLLVVIPLNWLRIFGVMPYVFKTWVRTTLRLTRDQLNCQWALGPFRMQRTMTVESIEVVPLGGSHPGRGSGTGRIARRQARHSVTGECAVTCGGKRVALAPFCDPEVSQQLTGLVLWKLHSWGRQV